MKAFILIVSIFFISSSSAQDLTEYGFAMITNNECENFEASIKSLKKLATHVETNMPNSAYMRCGSNTDGQLGCLILTESYETYEENMTWGETDDTWNRLIRQAWKECGIDDFGFGSDTLTFK